MKYYETNFEEYIYSVEKQNIHKELVPIIEQFPNEIEQFDNMIVYGPSGVGKYSQVLHLLKKYSPTKMKYQNSIIIENDKKRYSYNISDIHYEIDMALLGCNSKVLWHSIYQNIIDVVSLKPRKVGIIVCKNFHLVHGELLEIFYSYIQQYNNPYLSIKIKFILITENIGFLPENILNICYTLPVRRPSRDDLKEIYKHTDTPKKDIEFLEKVSDYKTVLTDNTVLDKLEPDSIINLKELRYFPLVNGADTIPEDIFNIICNNIISEMDQHENLDFTKFRDTIYDILVYNLDAAECIFYILSFFVGNGKLSKTDSSQILNKIHPFLKYYNNNYRPIYHLETILIYIIIKLGVYDEHEQSYIDDKRRSTENTRNNRKKGNQRSNKKEIQANGSKISPG